MIVSSLLKSDKVSTPVSLRQHRCSSRARTRSSARGARVSVDNSSQSKIPLVFFFFTGETPVSSSDGSSALVLVSRHLGHTRHTRPRGVPKARVGPFAGLSFESRKRVVVVVGMTLVRRLRSAAGCRVGRRLDDRHRVQAAAGRGVHRRFFSGPSRGASRSFSRPPFLLFAKRHTVRGLWRVRFVRQRNPCVRSSVRSLLDTFRYFVGDTFFSLNKKPRKTRVSLFPRLSRRKNLTHRA